jgi:hypothetical protein
MRPLDLSQDWTIPSPLRAAWAALLDPIRFAQAWPRVQLESGPPHLARGVRHAWKVKSPLGATLAFESTVTHIENHRTIGFTTTGDLQGHGECHLETGAPIDGRPSAHVRLQFHVVPRHRGLVLLGALPGGRRLLAWAHDRVMHGARRRLQELAAAQPLEYEGPH